MEAATLQTYYDADKCRQRNRVAARRDGVNAVPMEILGAGIAPSEVTGLVSSLGTLPSSDEDALERINRLLPDSSQALTLDDIYIHYAEAANSNFVSDRRRVFLDHTTLKNITRDAEDGVAFMNSHRDGSLSHRSELPFGRTFAGRYEMYRDKTTGRKFHRALVGLYMLKGVKPNGDGGPSTDDLSAMISAGTVFDVSVGLGGGSEVCNVCGKDLNSRDCPHVPGTKRNMTEEEQAAERERGVPDGTASWTYVDAHMGEVSAVYNGAVPGAGFRKALQLAKQHQLAPDELRQAKGAYKALLSKGDFDMAINSEDLQDFVEQTGENIAQRVLKALRRSPALQAEQLAVGELVTAPAMQQASAPANDERVAKLQAENEQLQEKHEKLRVQVWQDEAKTFAKEQIGASTLFPAEREYMEFIHEQLARFDDASPLPSDLAFGVGGKKFGSRLAVLEGLFAVRPKHELTGKEAKAEYILHNSSGTDAPELDKPTPERLVELLQQDELGKQALALAAQQAGARKNGKK